MKEHFADKTQWRAMLQAGNPPLPQLEEALSEAKDEAIEVFPPEFEDFVSEDDTVHRLIFPGSSFPGKVDSISLEKTATIEGRLAAIKGQYLIFEDGRVFNVRRHSGYQVRWDFS